MQKPKTTRWVEDLLGLGGLACACLGVGLEFGWPWSLIVGGGVTFALVLVSLILRGRE